MSSSTINARAWRVEFIFANNGEVTLEFRGQRRPPRGQENREGAAIKLSITMPAGVVVAMAREGRKGLDKLTEAAQAHLDCQRANLEAIRRAVA